MKNVKMFLAMVIIASFVFTGCNNDNEVIETSENEQVLEQAEVETLGKYIVDNIEFEDYISKVDKEIFFGLFNLKEEMVEDAVLYSSTGATAEEVAVLKSVDGNVQDVIEACEGRIQAQKEGFENYVPKELEKLSQPVLLSFGNTVVFIVCNDSEAIQELIANYNNMDI